MTVAVEIDDRIEKCRRILDLDPNSQIFAALAEGYRKKGELDKAFRICQNGLKIHPSYGSAHAVMAKINLDRRLFDWAEAEVQKAIEIDGTSRATELLLAEIYLYKGDYERATKLLKELRRTDPENSQIKRLLDIALKIPEEDTRIRTSTAKTAVVLPAVMEPRTQVSEVQQPVADNGLGASEILRDIATLPGVKGAMFINPEGLVVEAEWATSMDVTVCAAAMGEVNKFVNQQLGATVFGRVQSVLIESGKQVFYILRADAGVFLFMTRADVNLGTLRMRVAGLMERYRPR
jgi:predicted regulator of Ras-like GTPase activity (Roadblock/LC7/MglB family)